MRTASFCRIIRMQKKDGRNFHLAFSPSTADLQNFRAARLEAKRRRSSRTTFPKKEILLNIKNTKLVHLFTSLATSLYSSHPQSRSRHALNPYICVFCHHESGFSTCRTLTAFLSL